MSCSCPSSGRSTPACILFLIVCGSFVSARAQSDVTPPAIRIPDGTTFIATAKHSVKSGKAKLGDSVEFEAVEPTLIGRRVVVPRSAKLRGHVVEAQSADESATKEARLAVLIDSVTWKNNSVPACATVVGIAVKPADPARLNNAEIELPSDSNDRKPPGSDIEEHIRGNSRMNDPRRIQDPARYVSEMFRNDEMPSGYQFPKEIRIERYASRPSVIIRPKKNLELPQGEPLVIRQLQGGAECNGATK